MKRLPSFLALVFTASLVVSFAAPLTAHASFMSNNLIDDRVFDNTSSMTPQAIDNFLNQFPGSCISSNNGFQSLDPISYTPAQGYNYGPNTSAGNVIWDAAQAYGINPQVLLVTLQKEQSLVTGGSGICVPRAYTAATGYGCPDNITSHDYNNVSLYTINGTMVTSVTGTCVNADSKAGFSQQVIRAAWLLRFGEQRSKGNTGWNVQMSNSPKPGDHWDNSDDPLTCYGGPMTQGNFKRCSSDSSPTPYDGYITIDGVSTHMDTGGTAALYWYTPHFHGNQSFVSIFEGWFGATRGGYCISSLTAIQTDVVFQKTISNVDTPDFLINSGSGTGCVESHVWNPGFTSWLSHTASNNPSITGPDGQVLFGDLDGNGHDYPILFGLRGTGSGMIEAHVWSHDMQSFLVHTATNQPAVNPADCKIILADLNGDGKDDALLACLRNTASGMVELHMWNPGLQTWAWHEVTNMPAIDPTQATVIAGDIDGNHQDELIVVAYNHTGSGKVEFHVWNPGQWSWRLHAATNLAAIDPAVGNVQFADVDGNGVDEAVLTLLKNTGSGRIEFHVWNPGNTSWRANIASNQPTP